MKKLKELLKKIKNYFSSRNRKLDYIILQNQKIIELKEGNLNNIKHNAINNADKIQIFSNNLKTTMTFDAISEEEFKKIIPNIPIPMEKNEQENLKGLLSGIISGGTNVALTSFATAGLFKATVDPSTLMKLSSGGVGSAVIKGGKISQQAGFIQTGTSIFKPIVVFQLLSIVTGQYYMNNISKQLNAVQEKLDELLQLFHIERQAKLIKSFQHITEYLNKNTFVIEDFVIMKSIISELVNIREEYYLMLENSFETIKQNKHKSFNSLKDAKKTYTEFEKSGFLFKMKTSLIADELYHLSKITEFHMNICYKNPDINRINLILDKINEIKSFNKSSISFYKIEKLYEDIKKDTISKLEYSKKETWFNENEISYYIKNIKMQFVEFDKFKHNKINSILTTYKSLEEPFNKKTEIIIDNRNYVTPLLYLK